MARMTRRRFVQQTAFAAASIYARPTSVLTGKRSIFGEGGHDRASLDARATQELASRITGRVITPEEADYESARWVNNHAYDRHPSVIVRCNSDTDVARALDFGQSHRLPVAVRSGGHSAAGFSVCDGGVVIDLSGMKRVEVDPDRRVARVEAGALVGEVDTATQRFGLATTLGACPTVGIGGLTLGGGEGALMPKYGAACDNVKSAQVVTVDGRQLEASQSSNPGLFWAIRGGGGNFGVVTALQYQLHPVGEVLAGALMYPPGRIPELLQAYVEFTRAAPDEMSALAQVIPAERGPRLQVLVNYCGQPSFGDELLKPLRQPIKPQRETVKIVPYLEAQTMGFPPSAKPVSYFVTSLFLPDLGQAAIEAITAAAQDAPQRFRVMIVYFHGAVTRVPLNNTAFPLREMGYEVEVTSDWTTPAEKASAVRWANDLRAALRPSSHRMYVNGLSEPTEELMREAYGPNYARLVELKKKYDPTNVLRLNPNITPGGFAYN